MNPVIMSVSQLNRYVRSRLEEDEKLGGVLIAGEISNFKVNSFSGHAYFTLKDAECAVKCVCFRSDMIKVRFSPCDGMSVICQGRVSIYERDGSYQLYVRSIKADGFGDAALALEQLKARLSEEGLFAPERKRPLPRYPMKIAVITAANGAAIRDIENIISRRWSMCEILLFPASVQGADAPSELTAALKRAYGTEGIDVLIIGRGGGAAEDLSAFNDEKLARTLALSPFPTISAVGHETDYTVIDFIADRRAPTPSAAAELAVPDGEAVRAYIKSCEEQICKLTAQKVEYLSLRLDAITRSAVLTDKAYFIGRAESRINELSLRMRAAETELLGRKQQALARTAAVLDSLSPLKTLSRGYAAVIKDGRTVHTSAEIDKGDAVSVLMCDGVLKCTVDEKQVGMPQRSEIRSARDRHNDAEMHSNSAGKGEI